MSNLSRSKNKIKSMLKAAKPFHTSNLEYIKKVTGASFVGFQQYGELYHLRFVKNGVETFYKLHGTPNDITAEGYKKLLDLIIYGKNSENVVSQLGKL